MQYVALKNEFYSEGNINRLLYNLLRKAKSHILRSVSPSGRDILITFLLSSTDIIRSG